MRKYFTTALVMLIGVFFSCCSEAAFSVQEQVIHPNRKVILQIKYGDQDGKFGYVAFKEDSPLAPKAFAFDPNGNVYIGDSMHNRVQIFNNSGTFVKKIDLEKSERKNPLIVDISFKNKLLYVLVYRENVQIYDSNGRHVKTINLREKLDEREPWAYALSQPHRLYADNKGNIFISGFDNSLVKLNNQGHIIQKWSKVDFYLEDNGNSYVMNLQEEFRGKVVKYDADGNKLQDGYCNVIFPAPVTDCRLPEFIDKHGRMYRMFNDVYITRYSKQQSVLLGVDLYVDEDGYYYKVDTDGNIYTIKKDLIEYLGSE